jgi:hypothetical protein
MRRSLLLSCTLGACAAQERSGEQPITNGSDDPGRPAVVAIVDANDVVVCTATVIGPHTAITAAHCFIGRSPRTLRVFFGSVVGEGGTYTTVADARSHPAFDPGVLAHDIAMVTFRDESPAPPLAFDSRPIDASLVGTSFTVVGFGTTSASTADSGRKRVGTARVSDVAAATFEAMPSPSQPCRGDSGGPAFLSANSIAGIVSSGDGACSDHATYARVDVARGVLVDPYLADTALGTAHTGDACFYAEHCAEGPCLQTHDDPLLWFCSTACMRDDDCPDAMECSSDGCRYAEPSPGALGSPCEQNAQCTSDACHQSVCTISCVLDPTVCPPDYACRRVGAMQLCLAADEGGCGGCASGSSASLWLVGLWLLRRRRSASRASAN